jgi:RNA recognition motif. (a.k.a. RRM, RBD, or RNP domain)
MNYGSARVRTDGQSVEAQVAARTAAGVIHMYGAVASGATTDRDTGRACGFGFVEMPDSRAAQDAQAGLYGTSVAGRTLTVNEAQLREPRREPRRPRW